jgi:hypothetical protein
VCLDAEHADRREVRQIATGDDCIPFAPGHRHSLRSRVHEAEEECTRSHRFVTGPSYEPATPSLTDRAGLMKRVAMSYVLARNRKTVAGIDDNVTQDKGTAAVLRGRPLRPSADRGCAPVLPGGLS